MAELKGFTELAAKLKAKADAAKRDNGTAVVGYTASYGLRVHEDLQAHHNVGQAKFLEQPAREKSKEIASTYTRARKSGLSHNQAILMAGLFLQRESQLLCPVDTGALRASAFTKLEEG